MIETSDEEEPPYSKIVQTSTVIMIKFTDGGKIKEFETMNTRYINGV